MQADNKDGADTQGVSYQLNQLLGHALRLDPRYPEVDPGFTVAHYRMGAARQDDTEVFCRKLIGAAKRHAPAAAINITVHEIPVDGSVNGMKTMASAAAEFMESSETFRRYTMPLETPASELPAAPDVSTADLFSLLHAYGHYQAIQKLDASSFGSSNHIATVALRSSGVPPERLDKRVTDAVDSVFSQSLADSYAILTIAAYDGPEKASQALGEVYALRVRGGDFGAFSLAPLSYDTSASLDCLRAKLSLGADYSKHSKDEIWGEALAAACRGTEEWLRKHDVAPQDAVALSSTIYSMSELISSAAQNVTRADRAQDSRRSAPRRPVH